MRGVIRDLDDLSMQFPSDDDYSENNLKVLWTYWDWKESLKNGRRPKAKQSAGRELHGNIESDDFAEFEHVPTLS